MPMQPRSLGSLPVLSVSHVTKTAYGSAALANLGCGDAGELARWAERTSTQNRACSGEAIEDDMDERCGASRRRARYGRRREEQIGGLLIQ